MEGLSAIINPVSLLMHLVNIVILYIVFRLLLYKPVAKFMKSRQERFAKEREELDAEKAEAEALSKKLEGLTVKVAAKAGEGGRLFGAVTAKEISEALAEQHQVEIAKTKLVLDEPIKACGGYQIRAKLGYEVVGTVNVMVAEA